MWNCEDVLFTRAEVVFFAERLKWIKDDKEKNHAVTQIRKPSHLSAVISSQE